MRILVKSYRVRVIDYMKGVVIVWPSHVNEFKDTLEKELRDAGIAINLKENVEVNTIFVKNLLLEIHYGKVWWDEHIEQEYLKRVISGKTTQELLYFVIEHKELDTMVKPFKKSVREKHNLDKSYFHMSDPDCYKHLGMNCDCKCDEETFTRETLKHIDLLTHPNTVHFLNNAKYCPQYDFYKFFKIYKSTLDSQSHVNRNCLCIDNGGVLAAYGIRDTHDLDFLNTYNDVMSFNNDDVGCENINHRLEYKRLGYDIEDIVNNSNNYFYHFGEKFMAIRILKEFKQNRTHTIGTGHKQIRKKDINDYESIKNIV